MNKEALFSHNSDEWYTPKDLFEELDKEFNFTLDPCENPQRKLCPKGYSKTENGLTQNWGGGKWYSVIRLIPTLLLGLKNVTMKELKTTQ